MAMQAINAINRKIKDTEKEIANLQESKDETSAITQFMLSELRRKLKDLSEQRKHILAAQEKETISLRMYGETIENRKISNRILVSVLGGFQALLDSIATVSSAQYFLRNYAVLLILCAVCSTSVPGRIWNWSKRHTPARLILLGTSMILCTAYEIGRAHV